MTPLRRAAATLAALVVLAVNVYLCAFALYAATVEGAVLDGVLGAVELALAGSAAMVALAALASAYNGPFPERSWGLICLAIVLDALWYTFVFVIVGNA